MYSHYALYSTKYTIVYSTKYSVHCTMYSRGCSNFCIFLRAELQVPYISGNTAAKFQQKNNDRYPPANAILCPHLNNSTSELCRDTWLSWALT